MLHTLFEDVAFRWTIALVIGLPTGFLILGELIGRLRQRGNPLAGTLTAVRNLLLPAVATFLLVVHVAGCDRGSMLVRLLQTLMLLVVLHVVLSLFKLLLFAGAARGSWQARTPKLVRDLLQVGLILVGGGAVASTVWKVDLGSVIAALGVGSIVLGLALQEPLGNLFSGLMLTFERPFEVGDWISVGDKSGQVVEVNWRAVHIVTGAKELLIIPNSSLAKNNFSNYSRPTPLLSESIELSFSGIDPPNRVKQVILEAARSTPGVLADPPPSVRTARYDGSNIIYKTSFHVAGYETLGGIRDELLTRLWYVTRRAGLGVAYPTQKSINVTKDEHDAVDTTTLPQEVLKPFRQFGLTEVDEVARGLDQGSLKRYAAGERIMTEGTAFAGLYLIVSGEAVVSVRDAVGAEQTIARLQRGDYCGEKSLLSCQTSEVSVTATTDLEAVVLNSDQLHTLLEQNPRLAREIGQVMEARRRAIQHVRGARALSIAA
ncbi:MAG: mechanosensitive ion channel family protein [Gemmataceae bacterium]